MNNLAIERVQGTGISLKGNDIDTDRIIPARFLRYLTFDVLGQYAFEDDRSQLRDKGEIHPFDEEKYKGAAILVVNKNFGCGSSREHAPQSLHRFGIKAIIGESFGEIFLGNSVSVGMPCLTASESEVAELQDFIESNPSESLSLDVASRTIKFGEKSISVGLEEGPRKQFVEGRWDGTSVLISAMEDIKKTAAALPYINHWK